ncbi:MAG: hypothetical protein H6622_04910 [Halobacteriovoraceae bacterium]|nr:hypothetical protein [Halobacteriovoraceae bacterium]
MKRVIFTILISFITSNLFAAKFQFDLLGGYDTPQADDERTASAALLKFNLSTKPAMFRWQSGFALAFASGLTQGEFSFGFNFYPLTHLQKTPAQPFLFAEGVFGLGTYDELVRMDTGYGLGVGINLNFWKSSGMTVAVEQHKATETATRLWFGLFWF